MIVVVATLLAMLGTSPAPGIPTASPSPAVSPFPAMQRSFDAAILENSGSTNFAGYRIVVQPSGHAEVQSLPADAAPSARLVAPDLTAKLFADLRAGTGSFAGRSGPPHCLKSVSFGSVTTVTWRGRRSGDLQCGGGPPGVAADVARIAASLGLTRATRPGRFTIGR